LAIRREALRIVSVVTAFFVVVAGISFGQTSPAAADTASISVENFTAINGQARTFTISLQNFDDGDYLVVISADSGQLELSQTTGLTATGNYSLTAAGELGFSGNLTNITAALTGMTYTGSSNGSVDLSVDMTQQGTPSGGTIPVGDLYYNPGNGHYYEFVDNESTIRWTEAFAAASQRSLLGLTGYLATLTTSEENSFVAQKMDAPDIWIGATDDVDTVDSVTDPDAGLEGDWHWVSGPEAGTKFSVQDAAFSSRFENWDSGEPNNAGGLEHYAVTNWDDDVGLWNDLPDLYASVTSFVVEYGGLGTSTAIAANASATITVQASASAPGAPTLASVMGGGNASSTELSVAFTLGVDGGDEITGLEYDYKKSSESTWNENNILGSTTSPFTITGLAESTKYDVRIRATNSIGASANSGVKSGFTVGSTRNGILNGGFEDGSDNWTLVDPANGSFIDLATGSHSSPTWEDASNKLVVESCNIIDQQDYPTVAGRRTGGQSGVSQSNPWPRHDGNPPSSSSFTAGAVTSLREARAGNPASPSVIGTKSLELSSSVSTRSGWDVVHGPAAYSDGFSATEGDQITLDWFAAYVSDDFAIQGVLLDTSDCSQSRVLSATGRSVADMKLTAAGGTVTTVTSGSGWQRATVDVPSTRTDNSYRFVFVSGTFDRSGGLAAGAALYIDNISVGQSQTVTFAAQSNRGLGESPTLTATASSGGAISWTSNSPSVCTVDSSSGVVTMIAGGTCSISASQAGGLIGGTLYAAAQQQTQTFTVQDTRLSALEGTTSDLATAFAANDNASSYSLTVPTSTTSYTVTPTATQSGSAVITVNGDVVSSGSESDPIPLSVGANTITVVVTVGSTSTTTTITVTRASPPAPPSDGGAPAAAPAVPTPTPTVTPRPRRVGPAPIDPTVLFEPFLPGTVPSPPPIAPTGRVGGLLVPIQTQVTSPTGFSLRAGVLNLGLEVQQDQGVVRQNNTGGTEIEVRKGSTAAMTGTGLLPRSTVQVFLPLQGPNAKEIARIPVDDTGAFSGEAVFATRANERPLPIGRQLLQVVSLDEDGQQSVVEMAVNIAQPPPAPEPDRTAGATPTLRPGQFLATNAGEPEIVTVVPVPEDRQARVEGDGWQMAVDIPSANGSVAPSDEGGALLQLVRDESAVVSGSGFMPGTRADVWLFSEPTLLGTVDIDENGEFTGEVNIDSNVVVVGEHTLQLQGVGEDGYVRAANLGVVVNDTAAEATTEEAAGGFLWWLWLLVILVALVVWFAIWRYRRSREV
jgi:hypothetical protein